MSEAEKLVLMDSSQIWDEANACADAAMGQLRSMFVHDVEIHHIGATSVSGCLTKGDVDLVVRVDGEDFASLRSVLDAHYEQNSGSIRNGDFASYTDDSGAFPLGIQLVARGTQFDLFMAFRTRLRKSEQLRADYNELKRKHAKDNMAAYRAAKSDFIECSLAEES